MFKFNNKRDVDRHVSQMSLKLSESERSQRGLAIAKSYAKVNEYELARDWTQRYIDVKPDDSAAHKLMGEICERLQKPEQAITSYQRSYSLNSKQNDLIKHVCRLFLIEDGWSSSPAKAKYWCDLAETENIRDENVLSLRLKMAKSDTKKGDLGGSKVIEEMILKEIAARPHDVGLRIRLVKFLLDEKRANDAFKYCFDLEMKCIEIFTLSIDWYTTVALVLSQSAHESWNYWCLLFMTLEKQIFLTLKKDLSLQAIKQNNIKEVSNLLFEFDQVLKKASECLHSLTPVKELGDEFINHFRAQLSLHIATLLFQKQKITNNDQWHDTTKKCLPFLLFAFQSSTVNTESSWLKNTNEVIRNLFTHLKKEGAFRCTQAGRTILACKAGKNNELLLPHGKSWITIDDIFNQVREICADLNWRKNIYRILFANADQQSKATTSYFVQNSYFQEPRYEVISFNDVDSYEDMAQYLYPSSLDHHVYLGLGRSDLHTYKTRTFNGLNLSTANLINCNPETINRLDMDSFLYCATIQAKRRLEAEKASYENFNNKPNEKPLILPAANIIEGLCTEEQNEWWLSAYKIYKNISGENLAQLKATIQFGIEAVRGIDTPKIDVIILLKLGDILLTRAGVCDKAEERRHLELRVEYIYKFAIKMLRNRESDSMRRLFKFITNNYDVEREIEQLTGTAIGHLSGIYFKREEFREFIEDFNGLQNPWAHFFKAEAYKKLDECGKTPKKTQKIYIEKARENLVETLALLDNNENIDKNNPLRIRVEKDLKRLQYDLSSSFNDNLDFHNTSQNGYGGSQEEEIYHNASASSFRGRREIPNYSEKFTEVEDLIRKLSDLVISVRDDVLCVRNDITSLRDELLNIRGDITDLNVNKDATTTKAVSDIYKSIEDLSWNVTYMMNLSGAAGAMPPNMRFPSPAAVQLQQMYNTAYPIYPMMQQQQQQGRVSLPAQLPPHLDYAGTLAAMNYGTPILPSPTPPQQSQQPANGQKSSLIDALNTPSVLNTWTNTFNPTQLPQTVPQQQPQPIIQNKPVEKAPPVNVVITSSDPLPAQNSVVTQQTLSVTIPPQHIKNFEPKSIVSVQEKPKEPLKPIDDNAKTINITSAISFGGFTGTAITVAPSATPEKSLTKVTPIKAKEVVNENKQSPFANFTFGQSGTKSFSELFGSINNKTESAKVTPTETTTTLNTSANNEDEDVDHYEPTAQFEPVIPLPDLVETKTGEEDEEVKFVHRAKLLRYDGDAREWKERGIGEMKVLVKKDDKTKARLLMRREQIFKLCCNMPITKELKFTKLKETALQFGGQDFSEPDGMRKETLTVRFKTAELTKSFWDAVLDVQKNLGENKKSVEKPIEPEKKKEEEKKGFGDMFKPKIGSWTCEACYISNKPDTLYCVACESPKDNTVPKKEPKSLLAPAADAPKFSFGMPNATGFSFGMPQAPAVVAPSITSSETSTTTVKPTSSFTFSSSTSTTGFSFGGGNEGAPSFKIQNSEASSESTVSSTQPGFKFSFAPTTTPTTSIDKLETPSISLGGGESKASDGFNFVFKKKSPVKSKSPGKSRNDSVNSEGGEEGADENEYHEEEENQTYFTPVIPLPDKIEVKTGEEDEEILYSHRSKLFRFVEKEWKERGIGDIKILKHKETSKLRVIMRRDQIHKLCLNFFLISEIEFKRKDDNSWTFIANDFSEGELEPTYFAIRFKNKEIAEEFKKAIDNALNGNSSIEIPGKDSNAELLKRLMLPENFFEYTKASNCPGCIGCDDEKYVFVNVKSKDAGDEKQLSLETPKPIAKARVRRSSQDKRVSFKLAEKKENEKLNELLSTEKPTNLSKSEATTNIFAKFNAENPSPVTSNIFGSVFGSNNSNSNSIFSSSANTTTTTPSSAPVNNGSNIFGSGAFSFGSAATTTTATPSGNIFGGANKENQASPFANAFSSATPVFGSGGASIFGKSSISNTQEANKNIFGSSASSFSFADAAKELDKEVKQPPSTTTLVPDFLAKTNSFGGFAEIAANAGSSPSSKPFSTQTNASAGSFFGLTVKDDFFSKNQNKQNNNSSTNNDGDANESENVNDDNYDPHYDPIISLPDEIQVSTGEEDEEKLFGERAKLYRYDVKTKEWKERGVGELKILHHAGKSRYRLILRREQIFKLVLNQLITPDMHMSPMENSSKAFCWGGYNYAENAEGEAEQLAIRFKNEELATRFKTLFEECQSKVDNQLNPEND